MARERDAAAGWTTPGTLKLANARGVGVNLERLWGGCQTTPTTCAPELEHFVVEMLKITMRESPSKATPESIFAVVRPSAYLDGLEAEARSEALFEPLAGDLVVVYVVDEGGALRGAQREDLAELGMTQAELFAKARSNLVAVLPVPSGQPSCRPHALGAWDSGNYYESSRLLLSDFWREMAARTKLRIVVAAPAADALLVACDPTPTELTQLAELVRERERAAARAVSSTLLTWTPGGWQPLAR